MRKSRLSDKARAAREQDATAFFSGCDSNDLRKDGKNNHSGKVGLHKGNHDVIRDELREDTIVNSIGQGNIITSTLRDTLESSRDIVNDEERIVFGFFVCQTLDATVSHFSQVLTFSVTAELDEGCTRLVVFTGFELAVEDNNCNETDNRSNHGGKCVKTKRLPANARGTAEGHHVHNRDEHVYKDQGQDNGLKGANEHVSEETNPLESDILRVGVIRLPEGQTNTETDTARGLWCSLHKYKEAA